MYQTRKTEFGNKRYQIGYLKYFKKVQINIQGLFVNFAEAKRWAKYFPESKDILKQRINIFGDFSELNKEFWKFKRDQKALF